MKRDARRRATIDFDSIAEAWQKWEVMLEPCFARLNELLLEKAAISEGQQVLDLGSGSGIPALLTAKKVGSGKSVGLDVSESMLSVARRKAHALGLKNVSFQKHDVDSLPFDAESFDAVTARFSLMFVRSPQKTLREVFRVLKEGGRFSACVWGDPEKNPLPRKVLARYVEVPSNDPEVPGPFRFAQKGILIDFMKKIGFAHTGEQEIEIKEVFHSGQQYVDHILEASALWGSMLREMNPEQFKEARTILVEEAEKYRVGTGVEILRLAKIVYGRKPSIGSSLRD